MVRLRFAGGLVVIAVYMFVALPILSAAPEDPSADSLSLSSIHVMLYGRSGAIVREAVAGAIRRVTRPQCESLVGELTDERGYPLAWNLSQTGMTPSGYLAEMRFVEGEGTYQCGFESTVALTRPSSRVVFVCGGRFAHYFSTRRLRGEVIIIHEFLHSLGLGENPPSSNTITELVEERCGD